MIGAICRQDILTHPVITIRCFGWKVFVKALVAGERRTFLSLVAEAHAPLPAPETFAELVERCIGLELYARRIYESLAQRFDRSEPVKGFFGMLACQERDHAELLGLCRAATRRETWDAKRFDARPEAMLGLQQQLKEAESRADALDSLSDALRLVIQLESSEINRIYLEIMAASDSKFVRTLRVFNEAGREHISTICERIPEMDPELLDACQELRDGYARVLARV